ncbi:hypothetical protein L3Q82_015669 [Scortum barcoo]|uniref:Uncharacterized protein n=1 Tax=Scortum barcoo TaxID=214431 RepID=A0ACB8VNF2_9TELE|nr:hypothetical protein L3Q82_015669 [Scortum barcoo]
MKSCPEPVDLSGVPLEYHDLKEVFNKTKAHSLPPHLPYDGDLVPDLPLPSSRLYNLSRPERADLFFVEKKDSSLRSCIDFRGLNNIMVKNKYPLPLIDSAFIPLQGAMVFTKLDLRNAYHLVHIRRGDEWKTMLNTPLGHPLASPMPQHFLGFIIQGGQVQADPDKVKAVAERPIPTWALLTFTADLSVTIARWQPHSPPSPLQPLKRLNSHQAWWALFFSLFNFMLTCPPGSQY